MLDGRCLFTVLKSQFINRLENVRHSDALSLGKEKQRKKPRNVILHRLFFKARAFFKTPKGLWSIRLRTSFPCVFHLPARSAYFHTSKKCVKFFVDVSEKLPIIHLSKPSNKNTKREELKMKMTFTKDFAKDLRTCVQPESLKT